MNSIIDSVLFIRHSLHNLLGFKSISLRNYFTKGFVRWSVWRDGNNIQYLYRENKQLYGTTYFVNFLCSSTLMKTILILYIPNWHLLYALTCACTCTVESAFCFWVRNWIRVHYKTTGGDRNRKTFGYFLQFQIHFGCFWLFLETTGHFRFTFDYFKDIWSRYIKQFPAISCLLSFFFSSDFQQLPGHLLNKWSSLQITSGHFSCKAVHLVVLWLIFVCFLPAEWFVSGSLLIILGHYCLIISSSFWVIIV